MKHVFLLFIMVGSVLGQETVASLNSAGAFDELIAAVPQCKQLISAIAITYDVLQLRSHKGDMSRCADGLTRFLDGKDKNDVHVKLVRVEGALISDEYPVGQRDQRHQRGDGANHY